jgi:hypothetical protein
MGMIYSPDCYAIFKIYLEVISKIEKWFEVKDLLKSNRRIPACHAGAWLCNNNCVIYQYLESYLKSDQRHCGQVEQGITNVEGKKLHNSKFLGRDSIFVLTRRFFGG